jgi:hypothetical protein
VLSGDLIALEDFCSSQDYPHPLRLIRYYDAEIDKELVFLTNNMRLSALTIAQIYKARWQIEIFFKWIKQNLKIKLIGHFRECRIDSNLGCHVLLPAFGIYQVPD